MSAEEFTMATVGVLAVGDSSSTRTVYAVVAALGLIGVALLVLAVWLIKQTRPEPELLAPLERMDDRDWRKQDPAQKRRDLDEVRPAGARPREREKQVPDVDTDFAQNRPVLASFDDLQAQLAADARRRPAAGVDPLLTPSAPDDDTAEPDGADAPADAPADTDESSDA